MIIEINPVYLSKGCGTSHQNLSFPNPENSNPEKAEKFAWKQKKQICSRVNLSEGENFIFVLDCHRPSEFIETKVKFMTFK